MRTIRSSMRCAIALPATSCCSRRKPEGESRKFEMHLSRNGIGARIENDTFVVRRGRLRIPIATVRDVPLMMGGAARFQRENILAAIRDRVRAGHALRRHSRGVALVLPVAIAHAGPPQSHSRRQGTCARRLRAQSCCYRRSDGIRAGISMQTIASESSPHLGTGATKICEWLAVYRQNSIA